MLENITSSLRKTTINTFFPGTPKNHFLYWLFQLDDFTLKKGNLFLVVWIFQVFLETCSPKKKIQLVEIFRNPSDLRRANPDPNHLGRMLCKSGWPPRPGLIPHRGWGSGRFHCFFAGGHGRWPIKNMFYCTLPETNSEWKRLKNQCLEILEDGKKIDSAYFRGLS